MGISNNSSSCGNLSFFCRFSLVSPRYPGIRIEMGINKTIWVFPKIGVKPPKMDGENNGKPYEEMDDLGGKNPYFWKHPNVSHL